MKNRTTLYIFSAAFGLALTCSVSMAQVTIQTNSWTNTFPSEGNKTYFTGGTMAGTAWWFGSWAQSTNLMTNDPTMDAQGNTNSGSLYLSIPFSASGQQGWFFSNFRDAWGFGDGGVQIPLNTIKQLAFDIYVKSGTPLDGNGNLGCLQLNLIMGTSSGGFASPPVASNFAIIPISATAEGAWVHIVDSNTVADVAQDIAAGYTNAAGIAISLNNFNNYPSDMTYTFWIDNLAVTTGANTSAPSSLPPTRKLLRDK